MSGGLLDAALRGGALAERGEVKRKGGSSFFSKGKK